jgi:hypothetical protein
VYTGTTEILEAALKEVGMLPAKTFVAIPIAIVLAIGGCSTKEAAPARSSSAAPAPSSSAAPPAPQAAVQPAVAPPSSTPVIAAADGEADGTKAEIQDLRRDSGGTVTLKFALVNNSSKGFGFGYDFGDDANYHIGDFQSIGGVSLVDAVNKKKYMVTRDSESHCLCSRGLSGVDPGTRKNVWAQFPAPPVDVQKINVVIPHFSPANDVPISR